MNIFIHFLAIILGHSVLGLVQTDQDRNQTFPADLQNEIYEKLLQELIKEFFYTQPMQMVYNYLIYPIWLNYLHVIAWLDLFLPKTQEVPQPMVCIQRSSTCARENSCSSNFECEAFETCCKVSPSSKPCCARMEYAPKCPISDADCQRAAICSSTVGCYPNETCCQIEKSTVNASSCCVLTTNLPEFPEPQSRVSFCPDSTFSSSCQSELFCQSNSECSPGEICCIVQDMNARSCCVSNITTVPPTTDKTNTKISKSTTWSTPGDKCPSAYDFSPFVCNKCRTASECTFPEVCCMSRQKGLTCCYNRYATEPGSTTTSTEHTRKS